MSVQHESEPVGLPPEALGGLTPRMAEILTMRHGLDGSEPMSRLQISTQLQISKVTVAKTEMEARRRIAIDGTMKEAASFLGIVVARELNDSDIQKWRVDQAIEAANKANDLRTAALQFEDMPDSPHRNYIMERKQETIRHAGRLVTIAYGPAPKRPKRSYTPRKKLADRLLS